MSTVPAVLLVTHKLPCFLRAVIPARGPRETCSFFTHSPSETSSSRWLPTPQIALIHKKKRHYYLGSASFWCSFGLSVAESTQKITASSTYREVKLKGGWGVVRSGGKDDLLLGSGLRRLIGFTRRQGRAGPCPQISARMRGLFKKRHDGILDDTGMA